MNIFIVFTFIFAVFSPSIFVAADTTQSISVGVRVPCVLDLSWNAGMGDVHLTGSNGIAPGEFAIGYREAIPGGELIVSSNTSYDLTALAGEDFFWGGDGAKPISDLSVSIDGGESVQIKGAEEISLISSHQPEANALKKVEYRIRLNTGDAAGSYSVTITYTIKPSI